jgi:hypothetical protein
MQATLMNIKRLKKEIQSLKEYNPKVENESIIITINNYKIIINPFTGYPLASVKYEINISPKIEMMARFCPYIFTKLVGVDIADLLTRYIIKNIIDENEFYNKKIQCKKYLLDYGKSSDAMFDYDDKMQLNPSKFLIYFIEQYMELCKKYLYSFKYMIAI